MMNKVEIAQLKKIIIKYEKKIRELEKNDVGDMKLSPSLNDKEKKVVNQLMMKYNCRIHRKSRSVSYEPTLETKNECENLELRRERCGRKRCKSRNRDRVNSVPPNIEKNPDIAIMMMDYLFETESNC
ncbi:hypothetical protein JTB14_021257 [Gonioctena quinquepunctata]|nr:hypothetical protein JTB14_021257 [Gonioctena quinquepunctata]